MARPATFTFLCVLLFLAIAGCGMGTNTMNGVRLMQSLAVSPSSADAQKFTDGQVQFTATATFNMSPTMVMSPAVLWSVGNPSFMSMSPTPTPMSMAMAVTQSAGPTINASGLAQCNGFTGIVTIEATAPADPNVPISQMSTMMRTVTGTAHMMCP